MCLIFRIESSVLWWGEIRGPKAYVREVTVKTVATEIQLNST